MLATLIKYEVRPDTRLNTPKRAVPFAVETDSSAKARKAKFENAVSNANRKFGRALKKLAE